MFKRINNWHLSALVVVVSLLSVAMVQKYVLAQWADPTTEPGDTPANNIVLNPLAEDLSLGSSNIEGSYATIDGDGVNAFNVTNGGNLCLNDPGDDSECIDAWSDISGAAGSSLWTATSTGIYYDGGYVGIGTDNPHAPIDIVDGEGEIKIRSDYIWHLDSGIFKISAGGKISIRPTNSNNASTTFSGLGRVGILDEFPGYPLHIRDDGSMAVVNLDNEGSYLWTGTRLERDNAEKWFIGMNDSSNDLLFRSDGVTNDVVLTSDGKLSVNFPTPVGRLHVYDDTSEGAAIYAQSDHLNGGIGLLGVQTDGAANVTALGGVALSGTNTETGTTNDIGIFGAVEDQYGSGVYGKNTAGLIGGAPGNSSAGVYGEGAWGVVGKSTASGGRGVYGYGYYGVKATASGSGGTAIYGEEGTGSYAGKFIGDVLVASGGDLKVDTGYLQMANTSAAPTDVCNNQDSGKMILDNVANVLYICTGWDSGWKAITL